MLEHAVKDLRPENGVINGVARTIKETQAEQHEQAEEAQRKRDEQFKALHERVVKLEAKMGSKLQSTQSTTEDIAQL